MLVVDDDDAVRLLVTRYLALDGYVVTEAADSRDAIAAIAADPPDLVLLDLTLPTEDGLDVLAKLRRASDVPVILLTGRGAEGDRVLGLKLGADDYVVKPFSPAELSARISSVLRRARPQSRPGSLRFDGLSIDPVTREVRIGSQLVVTTAKEFDLLAFLAAAPRQVFSRDQLLHQVWGSSSEWQDDATVTEHVRRLRRKVEVDPDRPRWIVTVRGVGYRFEP